MTERQRRFVEHYLVLRDAAEAALRAGYKPSAARSRGDDWPAPKPRKGAGLTPRQRRFAEEYLIDANATQAAIRAGYSRRARPLSPAAPPPLPLPSSGCRAEAC